MKNLIEVNSSDTRVISLYEICKILGKRHSDAKKLAEEIQAKDGFGEVRKIRTSNSNNVSVDTYSYTKKQALMIGARLDSSNIIKLVNKLEQATKPLSFEEMAKQTILLADKKIKELENTIANNQPKVNFANAITGTTSNIDFETFAKALFDAEGIKMGRNNLMKWFRDNGYLTSKNKPYQAMLDRGLMTLKEGSYINQSTQELVTYTQPRITGKGQMYFTNKLLDEKVSA